MKILIENCPEEERLTIINKQNDDSKTPLHFAARGWVEKHKDIPMANYCEVVSILISTYHADASLPDKENKTPLDIVNDYCEEEFEKNVVNYHNSLERLKQSFENALQK